MLRIAQNGSLVSQRATKRRRDALTPGLCAFLLLSHRGATGAGGGSPCLSWVGRVGGQEEKQ